MVRRIVRRDWTAANDEHRHRPCRVCGQRPVQLAHVIGRAHDPAHRTRKGWRFVHPLAVVPLCRDCHAAYDAHRLDLARHLTVAEHDYAVTLVGNGNAERRIRGRAWLSARS